MKAKQPMRPPIDSPLAREFLLEGGRRGVLLIHGFTGTPAQMRPMGDALNRDGYTVACPLLPGHGTVIEDMEATGWSDWLRAVRDAFNMLAARCDEISVAGLSMGGILALILASEMPVKAAVSIAAPLRLLNRKSYLAPVVGPFLRYQGWPKDPDKVANREEDPYAVGYSATPVRKVADLLRLIRIAERGLDKIACPLLIVQPRKDDQVRPDSPKLIYAGAVNAPYKEILRLENSKHVCTYAPEFDKLYAAVSRILAGDGQPGAATGI